MARSCEVCQHEDKRDIDRLIVTGVSKAKISKDYGVPYHSVVYHENNHISRQLAAAYEKKELDNASELLYRIDSIIKKAQDIFERNYDMGKDSIALKALSEQRATLELLSKISYALHQSKVAELEQQKESNQQESSELQKAFFQATKRLTKREKEMFDKIFLKALRIMEGEESSTDIILPDNPDAFPYELDEKRNFEHVERSSTKTNNPTNEPEPEPDETDFRVGHFNNSKQIPPIK